MTRPMVHKSLYLIYGFEDASLKLQAGSLEFSLISLAFKRYRFQQALVSSFQRLQGIEVVMT
jgi:hypothetical protein